MALGKTRGERFDQALDFIAGVFPGQHGGFCRTIMEHRIDRLPAPTRKAVGDALSIPETVKGREERDGLRAVLLLRFTVQKDPLAMRDGLIAQYGAYPATRLREVVRGLLPLSLDSTSRATWAPGNFTAVPPTSAPAPSTFRYIVFGMPNTPPPYGTSYTDIIKDPTVLRTWMISASVIDERRVATYYPYGLILEVPENCVLTTATRDQGFTNYPKLAPGTTPTWRNMDPTVHVREAMAQNPTLLTPDDVLNGKSSSAGKFGYNEVVVLGTAPEGHAVKPKAFFMKVDSQGNRYVFKKGDGPDGPYVTDAILRLLAASSLPVVTIPDASGRNG